MSSITESANQSIKQSALDAGYNTLDEQAQIEFIKYDRYVLPVDGYIFYLRNMTAPILNVGGSIHYRTDVKQLADETIGINRVLFTTDTQIQDFNALSNTAVYIGQVTDAQGNLIRFSFSSSGKFYESSGLYHYQGDAIYPAMYSQIIDNPTLPITLNQVATNSLPIWLQLNALMPIYPAFLTPTNLQPPYATVEITDTVAKGSAPYIDSTGTHTQLAGEKCKLIIYGLSNNTALDFQDYIINQSLVYDNFGIENSPIIKDEQRTQSELTMIANKKSIEFEINYYQQRVNTITQQLILSALCSVTIN
jgi:hypothetical protein